MEKNTSNCDYHDGAAKKYDFSVTLICPTSQEIIALAAKLSNCKIEVKLKESYFPPTRETVTTISVMHWK
jgi:hypothetical protein